jgi:hypothetical protein
MHVLSVPRGPKKPSQDSYQQLGLYLVRYGRKLRIICNYRIGVYLKLKMARIEGELSNGRPLSRTVPDTL